MKSRVKLEVWVENTDPSSPLKTHKTLVTQYLEKEQNRAKLGQSVLNNYWIQVASLFHEIRMSFLSVQLLSACAASLSFLMMGAVRGYSSPAIPSMNATLGTGFSVDDFALFASLPPTGSLTAALLAGPLLERLGRRKTIIAASIPWVASFLMIGLSAGEKYLIFAGRVIMGAMVGFSAPATQIYIAECAEPEIRGRLGSITAVMLALGIVITYAIGALVEWDQLALILSGFPVLLFLFMLAMPESPVWLLDNHQEEEARRSLQRLRGRSADIREEFERISQNVLKSRRVRTESFWVLLRRMLNPRSLRPLGISLGLMLFQQMSGINVVIYFTVTIFQTAGSTINDYLATLVVGLVQLLCTLPAVFLVDKYGRRILLILSGTFMFLALAAMTAYFYLQEATSTELSGIRWAPLASLVVFIIAYSGGYSNVPYLVMSELFPSRFRNVFGSLSTSANLSTLFVILYTFPILSVRFGSYSAFGLYACFNFIGVLFVYFCLPETKGKTLEEIESHFTKRSEPSPEGEQFQLK